MEPMLGQLREVAEAVEYAPARIPIVSNVTGEACRRWELCRGDYWVRHVREAVRFAQGVESAAGGGVTRFLELGPDGVLAATVHECLDPQAGERALLAAALRGAPRGARRCWLPWRGRTAPACASTGGAVRRARRAGVDLPTYAFQRERLWLEAPKDVGDLGAAGLRADGHPLLGAAVRLAGDRDEWLFTGRVSIESQPWVADHVVLDTVVVPGTAFAGAGAHRRRGGWL